MQTLLVQIVDGKKVPETDIQASMFWLSSPTNRIEDNVAVGANKGFWFEMKPKVSNLLPPSEKVSSIGGPNCLAKGAKELILKRMATFHVALGA